jgi:hypothetical protein
MLYAASHELRHTRDYQAKNFVSSVIFSLIDHRRGARRGTKMLHVVCNRQIKVD